MILEVFREYLQLDREFGAQSSQEQFTHKFYLERIIDILEAIPPHKNFIKDAICDETPQVDSLFSFMASSCS